MITPEINAKARAAYNKTRRHLDPTGEKRMQAALQAVEADLKNAALESAATVAEDDCSVEGVSIARAIRALKTKVTP